MINAKRLGGRIVPDTVELYGETFWREKTIDAHFKSEESAHAHSAAQSRELFQARALIKRLISMDEELVPLWNEARAFLQGKSFESTDEHMAALKMTLQRCRVLNHTHDDREHCAMCIGIDEGLKRIALTAQIEALHAMPTNIPGETVGSLLSELKRIELTAEQMAGETVVVEPPLRPDELGD